MLFVTQTHHLVFLSRTEDSVDAGKHIHAVGMRGVCGVGGKEGKKSNDCQWTDSRRIELVLAAF